MNGARSTYMRKGYLLTALAAAVLLAASSGTAYAQRVTIGFVGTNGEITEKAYLNPNSPDDPQMITVRVQGLRSGSLGSLRESDIEGSIGTLTITPNKNIRYAIVGPGGAYFDAAGTAAPSGTALDAAADEAISLSGDEVTGEFNFDDELNLVFVQSEAGGADDNWLGEMIELKLAVTGTASVSPDVYTLAVTETDVAPVAKFLQPSFTLSEQSERVVQLDVASGRPGARIPPAAAATENQGEVSVRVSNHTLVMFGDGSDVDSSCPARTNSKYNRILFRIDLEEGDWADPEAAATNFDNTGVLQTVRMIGDLAGANTADEGTADLTIYGCGDGAGIRDPQITLTIMDTNLTGTSTTRANGDISVGSPLMISIDSDEAVPTLSFSPTNVEIDEGGSTSTVLLAEGSNADDVGMVKLSVEGDAMVSLMQDGEMLEEMGGYVYVDLDGNTSARLEAMSHSDPDLMDGDMAVKTWKLMEGGTDGANIGEGYWFTVDVRGSTAVPALPLVGQLLLALFLMAGGARLYRRRQG